MFKDGPAELAGMLAGDHVLEVEGVDVTAMTHMKVHIAYTVFGKGSFIIRLMNVVCLCKICLLNTAIFNVIMFMVPLNVGR